ETRQRLERQELHRDGMGPRVRAARAIGRRGAHPRVTNFPRAIGSLSSRLGQFRTPPAKAGFLLATAPRLVLTLRRWNYEVSGGALRLGASAVDQWRAGRRVRSPIILTHPSMACPAIPTLSAHGAEMPAIGFGTSSLGDCGEIVASALRLGYRHIDTAWKYG